MGAPQAGWRLCDSSMFKRMNVSKVSPGAASLLALASSLLALTSSLMAHG
jgi:hypothetical protein